MQVARNEVRKVCVLAAVRVGGRIAFAQTKTFEYSWHLANLRFSMLWFIGDW